MNSDIAAPQSDDVISETPSPLSLSPDQIQTLFGDLDPSSGETYTVTLSAGDKDESGFQTFTVASPATPASEGENSPEDQSDDAQAEDEEAASDESGPADPISDDEPTSSDEEKSVLGYDREKYLSRRGKKPAPSISAKDLSY